MSDDGLRIAIFGASSGIATEIARLYAGKGARLVLAGRDTAPLEAAASDLRIRGAGAAATLRVDFADPEATIAAADRSWQSFGGLDIALIAYGSLPEQAALETDPGAAQAALSLNFVSPGILALRLAALFEAQRHGTIAAITSVAGDRGRRSNYLYGAAKGGLQRLLEGLRHRLHPAGVQVLDIRPGFVATRMTEHLPRGGPLWAEPGKVAGDIVSAIERRRAVLYTPWFWRVILALVRALPRPLFHRTAL